MGQKYKKLSDHAREQGVTYRTAWNHYKQGKIPGSFMDSTGHVRIPIEDKHDGPKKAALYARVSTNDRKKSLEGQLQRIREFSVSNGYVITHCVKEIASGMNDQRKKLKSLLEKDDWDVLVVENKDRLTRFGFNYIQTLLKKQGKDLITVNQKDTEKEDLMQDLVSIIYSFSARMYGLRKRKKKQEILNFLQE